MAKTISIDSSGNVYVAGDSRATWGSPLNAYAGGEDAFVATLSPPIDSDADGLFDDIERTMCTSSTDPDSDDDGMPLSSIDRCIGCGNCVLTCEANACILHEREQKHIPPSAKETMFNMIWEKKQENAKQDQPE